MTSTASGEVTTGDRKVAPAVGIKIKALLALGNCVICGKKQLEGALPLFYCVTISRCGFDQGALRRAAGLELQLGPLAQHMGPDEDLAKVIDGPHNVFVHELCADKIGHLLQLIPETKGGESTEDAV